MLGNKKNGKGVADTGSMEIADGEGAARKVADMPQIRWAAQQGLDLGGRLSGRQDDDGEAAVGHLLEKIFHCDEADRAATKDNEATGSVACGD